MIKIYCDVCGSNVDKSEKSNGFGALSIIRKDYTFNLKKIKGIEFKQKDFDICNDCCSKIEETIENIKKSKEKTTQ